MKRNLLLTPGPTQVPARVCEALSRPIIHHRTPQFQVFLKEAIEGLKEIYQTKNDVYILASSGTGAMEASVCSLLSPGDKVMIVEGGKFGERWTEICQAYGIQTQVIKAEWGKVVDPKMVEAALKKDKTIKAVFTTLAETSTGVTFDIKSLGKVVKETPAVLVVDAVSGLGVEDLKTDAWGVDVVASASHKGLMLPPGLGFVSLSAKAKALMVHSKCPKYYFDLRAYEKALASVDTPYTPAIGLVVALLESLKMIKEAGLDNRFAHYRRLAQATRKGALGLGLKLYADESCASNVLTSICVPKGIDGEKLVKIMRDQHGVSIAGGQAELKGKVIRIAHMGCLDEYDLLTGIACLEKVLRELGYRFELGAGVASAQKFLNGGLSL